MKSYAQALMGNGQHRKQDAGWKEKNLECKKQRVEEGRSRESSNMGRNHSMGLNIEDVDSRPLNHMEVDRSLATAGQFLQDDNSKQVAASGLGKCSEVNRPSKGFEEGRLTIQGEKQMSLASSK
ncbi:hypothetical protein Ancab_014110, partial [Ancistrocladus abbreviatus]